MKYQDCVVAYNPNSSDIWIGPKGFEPPDVRSGFRWTVGGAFGAVFVEDATSPHYWLARCLIDFRQLIVRDRVDVHVAHVAFCIIDEYRDSLSTDTFPLG